MSATVDANILLYASNADDELCGAARELLERLGRGPDLLYLFWPTIMGYLRISTHPGIFPRPLSPRQATDAVGGLLRRPNVRTPAEGSGFWTVFGNCAGVDTRGSDVPDAHLAALMRQHGVGVIYTRDRDFRRYAGIDPRDPFAERADTGEN